MNKQEIIDTISRVNRSDIREDKQTPRAEIEAKTRDYLANGKTIQVIPPGIQQLDYSTVPSRSGSGPVFKDKRIQRIIMRPDARK